MASIYRYGRRFFAFGTKDVNGGGNGVKCVISPSNKTIKIYHSDWDGTDNIKET